MAADVRRPQTGPPAQTGPPGVRAEEEQGRELAAHANRLTKADRLAAQAKRPVQ